MAVIGYYYLAGAGARVGAGEGAAGGERADAGVDMLE
jgi:uncharacterized membrane protein